MAIGPLLSGRLWRVEAPHFVAGLIEAQDGDIIFTAPILGWASGKKLRWFRGYCACKGWKCHALGN